LPIRDEVIYNSDLNGTLTVSPLDYCTLLGLAALGVALEIVGVVSDATIAGIPEGGFFNYAGIAVGAGAAVAGAEAFVDCSTGR